MFGTVMLTSLVGTSQPLVAIIPGQSFRLYVAVELACTIIARVVSSILVVHCRFAICSDNRSDHNVSLQRHIATGQRAYLPAQSY